MKDVIGPVPSCITTQADPSYFLARTVIGRHLNRHSHPILRS
jgi:hypothetical protein